MPRGLFSLFLLLLLAVVTSCATGSIRYASDPSLEDYEKRIQAEAPENINGLFPPTVHIKTLTQTFNTYYDFQLYDGKIYYKGRDGKSPEDWSLLKNGLPRRTLDFSFTRPEAIRAIAADANLLTALSDEGIFYFMMCTRELTAAPFEWVEKRGFPSPMTLKLDSETSKFRGWGMSRRGSEVLWYEDINGNQHHYGTMGIQHNYMLMADGQEIRFSDTGLPADFSHNLLGPERGRFIAEGISASASTVFLINRAGEMYTRLADYDTLGSDPMFYKYSYDPDYKDPRPGSDYGTNFNTWILPSEDWRKQPEIPLYRKAALSSRITILQNGQGNEARELRVAGLDPEGNTGYYHKQIFETNWKFQKAELNLEGKIFDPVYDGDRSLVRGPSQDRDLPGKIWVDGEEVGALSVQLKGFNLLEGSCLLEVSNSTESIDMDFYPVEMWYYMKRGTPGRDGTYKLMLATLAIDHSSLSSLSESFQHRIHRIFDAYDRNTFSLFLEASEGFVLLNSNVKDDSALKMVFSDNPGDLKKPTDFLRRTVMFRTDPLVRIYEEGSLLPDSPSDLNDKGNLLDLIYRNKQFLQLLEDELKEMDDIGFRTNLSAGMYRGVSVLFTVTGLRFVDVFKIKTVTMHSDTIIDRINESARLVNMSKSLRYTEIIQKIEERIKEYKAFYTE